MPKPAVPDYLKIPKSGKCPLDCKPVDEKGNCPDGHIIIMQGTTADLKAGFTTDHIKERVKDAAPVADK